MVALTEWRKRITIDPTIHHGDPCITGTRVPISVIVGSVADGDSFDLILKSYPQLSMEDVQAALLCAAEAVNHIDLVRLARNG
jgi:uncharacterized protein (DUF433 family)